MEPEFSRPDSSPKLGTSRGLSDRHLQVTRLLASFYAGEKKIIHSNIWQIDTSQVGTIDMHVFKGRVTKIKQTSYVL